MDRDWVLVGLALAALVIIYPTVCSNEPSPPGPVLLVGDSLLFQASEELDQVLKADGWEVHMEAVLGSGIAGGGNPAVDWSSRMDDLIDEHDPEIVVIELGTNGCGPGCTGLDKEIDDLLDEVRGVPVVLWLNVRTDAPLREDPRAINAALDEAEGDADNLTLLSLDRWFRDHPELVAVDGVHLTSEGQLVFADRVRAAIRDHADMD